MIPSRAYVLGAMYQLYLYLVPYNMYLFIASYNEAIGNRRSAIGFHIDVYRILDVSASLRIFHKTIPKKVLGMVSYKLLES